MDDEARARVKPSRISRRNRLRRSIWNAVWMVLYRPSPTVMHGWRRMLLRCFGAKIGVGAHPYPSVSVWAPWMLEMGPHSCLASHVKCYCVAPVTLGEYATVSQYSHLCTASHDYRSEKHEMISGPIYIGTDAWIAADAFVGPGVRVGDGAVVGARSSVFRDVAAWTVVVGTPAKVIGKRPDHVGRAGTHGIRPV
jgi:putative colanic acid biosynthesis acetyltransferase WcaF